MIIYQFEQVEHNLYLNRPEISGIHIRMSGYSLFGENLHEFCAPVAGSPEQYYHVAISQRTVFSRTRIINELSQEILYDVGHHCRFPGHIAPVFLRSQVFPSGLFVDQGHAYRSSGLFRHCQPVMQKGFFIILQFSHMTVHDPGEDVVYRRDYIRLAAEVLPEVEPAAVRFILVFIKQVFVQEESGVSQAEAVDALLDIPYHKKVVNPGDAIQKSLLHLIAVLVFVHKYVLIALPVFRSSLGVLQNLQGEVLQIVKVQHPLFGFAAAVFPGKGLQQLVELI